ncbi:MAG: hypothetical protein H0V17_17295 [Deltaproteobacteria bacterium]|nr:hypothetical protein [Deltaproteobacteria bacterium]
MIEWLRTAVAHLLRSPGWQLVVGGAILALAFPSRMPGAVGMSILAGALGVATMRLWPKLPDWLRTPNENVTSLFVITLVVSLGLSTFWDTLTVAPDWQMGDWGPQHAVLAKIMSSMPGLDTPVWNLDVGTGDAPLELYPKLAYLVIGNFAAVTGLEHDLPLAMMIVAVLVHVGLAATTTVLAMRVAPKPIAFVIGTLALVDSGAVAHGGSVGLFRWALLHSAMSLLFGTLSVIAVVGALRKPRLRTSIAIWLCTAVACAAHPAGLLGVTVSAIALGAVALLASDVPPRRALVAIGHLSIGVALGAAVWLPLAARILEYGQHFPNQIRTPARLLEDLLASPSPITAYAMLAYAGYFGIIAGLWSRKAPIVYLSTITLVLLVGLCDAPYLAFDVAPGHGVARIGTERLAQIARPFLAAVGAYGIAIFVRAAIASWRDAKPTQRMIAAALIGVFSLIVLRVLPTFWRSASARAYSETQVIAPDPFGRVELSAWAAGQVAKQRPDAYGRAMFELDTHEHFHLTAETGLPTLHLTWQPAFLLRERLEDMTSASLARFNIRWIIGVGRSPTFGDADSEFVLGTFHIRTVKEWDGKLARVEKGEGDVKVTAIADDRIEIDVTAKAPVLVALGTGHYPRWRAQHASSGVEEPVYAMRAHPTATLSVVSAWVAPGKTVFTVDGTLPSDGRGRGMAGLALLAAIAAIVVWRVPRFRIRALRRVAGLRARAPSSRTLAAIGVPLAIVVLLAKGCSAASGPVRHLELGTGLSGNATVEARVGGGAWQTCDYNRLPGTHICEGLLVAYDGMTALLNDAMPSWGFNTPGFLASADIPGVEMRVRFREHLAGTYWMAATGDGVILDVSAEETRVVDRNVIAYSDQGRRTIDVTAPIPTTPWQFTFVREDTMLPSRAHLAKPPDEPPAALDALQ